MELKSMAKENEANNSHRAGLFRRRLLRPLLLVGVPLVAAVAGLILYLNGGRYVATDNAYVAAPMILVTPAVSGRIVDVSVHEGQGLKVGDKLFAIDPSAYSNAVSQAEAHLSQVIVDYRNSRTNLASLESQIALSHEKIAFKQSDADRKTALAKTSAASQEDVDQVMADLNDAQTRLAELEQQAGLIRNQLMGDGNLPLEQYPPYAEATARLKQARLDLANTQVVAAMPGIASQVSNIQLGRYITAGTAVFSIVADEGLWVDANLKETDLTHVKVGQQVDLTVDAFPGRTWHGHVASISPATGAEFAILPPQNASGNWVKVVQRVAVRVEFATGEDVAPLRAGMSTVVSIDTGMVRQFSSLFGGTALASQ